MNVFFGKISTKNKKQVEEHCYYAPKDHPVFQGLDKGDYVFMLCNGKVHLWQADDYVEDEDGVNGKRLFNVIFENIGKKSFFLSHIKYFKLSMDLVVKSHRQTKEKGFFKIDFEDDFTEEKLKDRDTYSKPETFRKTYIRNSIDSVEADSYDIQLYFDGNELKLAPIKNSDSSFTEDYRDNLPKIGNNRPKKDKTLSLIKLDDSHEKAFLYNSQLNAAKIYDAFMVDYGKSEDEEDDDDDFIELSPQTRFWCFNHNYSGCTEEGLREFKKWADDNLACKMQQEFEKEGSADHNHVESNWKNASKIKPNDVVFFRAGDYSYCFGLAIPPRKKGDCTKQKVLSCKKIIDEHSSGDFCSQKGYDGYVFFDDAEVFYENFSDGGSWGQRIDVEEWFPSKYNGGKYSIKNNSFYKDSVPYWTIREMNPKSALNLITKMGYDVTMANEATERQKEILMLKKNIILQGAPGTGKTYSTAALALSLLEIPGIDSNNHEQVMSAYQKLLIEMDSNGRICNNGQIGFVTFHQSMDYEDFIEGIKPLVVKNGDKSEVQYDVVSGIFKSLVKEAKFAYVDVNNSESKAVETFDQKWTALVDWANEEIANNRPCELQTKNNTKMKILEASGNAIVMQGESAQRSTTSYRSEIKTLWDVFGDRKLDDIENFNKEFRKFVGGNCTAKYAIIKKLQENTVSSDTVQLDNCSVEKKDELIDLLKNDDFKKTDVKKFVLVIDEINRGNVSKIFGELISLLEADKRAGGDHPLTVTLPYSKEQFSVPSNLYIIGTMNTTDRSVGSIDYAVRRRFAFVTLEADESAIENYYKEKDESLKKKAVELFGKVRDFLNNNDNRSNDMGFEDLMVGHSYFIAGTLDELNLKWEYEVIPLLKEYQKDGLLRHSAKIEDILK